MDNLIALGLTLFLVLRLSPWIIKMFMPRLYQQLQPGFVRFVALVDIAGGTLMIIIVGLLVAQRAWLIAALFGLLAFPSVRALITGFRTLMRLATKDTP